MQRDPPWVSKTMHGIESAPRVEASSPPHTTSANGTGSPSDNENLLDDDLEWDELLDLPDTFSKGQAACDDDGDVPWEEFLDFSAPFSHSSPSGMTSGEFTGDDFYL